MSYSAPAGNQVDLPIGGGVSYTPPAGGAVPLPIEDAHPAPAPVNDAYDIALNTARTISAPGVLSNDTTYTGTITSHTSPAHGSLTFGSDGSFTYTPTTGYTGADAFTYTLGNDDGFGTATVNLTVWAPPTAVGHSYNTGKNTPLTVSAPGVLNGATINGATITAHTTPAHGSLTLNSDGSFTYTPVTNFTGTDSFNYTLSNYAGSSSATISLTITAAPVAVNDSYSTPYNTPLVVAAPGPLYNDDLEGATATLDTSPTHGSITFNTDGSFTYTPTSGYSGSDSFTYLLTNIAGTSTGTVNLTVIAIPATVRYLRNLGGRMPWSETARRAAAIAAAWIAPARKAAEPRVAYAAAARAPRAWEAAWTTPPRRAVAPRGVWAAGALVQRSSALVWAMPPRRSSSARSPFGMQPRREVSVRIPWLAPPRRHVAAAAPFVVPLRKEQSIALPWQHALRRVRRTWIPWDSAQRVPYAPGSPGVEPPPVTQPPPFYVPPNGAHVDLPLICPWFDEPGGALGLPIGPFACYAASIFRRRYIVLNTASVVRLPERTPIDVSSGSVSSSVDDMYFSFQLTLDNPAHLAYLLPDSDGNKLVEINLNGYVFVALIEDYDRQRKFPSQGVTVSGRSQTVVLDDPIAPTKSFVQGAEATAQQLVDGELTFTGFTADYGAVDWLVPAGTYAYDRATPMQSIRQVAAASGSIVQSHPWDTVVQIRPRYPVSPWNWGTAAVDKTIQDDIILSDSLRPATKPLYNYVLVSGEQVGVSDPIERAGSAGDIRADQIIDRLIVTHPVALERGRNRLSDRGNQASIEMMIPLGVEADTSLPGLVSVLDLCEIVEPAGWHGLCTASRINFQTTRSGNGAAVLIIEQYVTVERHYDDAD
jgi:hypothetical protein